MGAGENSVFVRIRLREDCVDLLLQGLRAGRLLAAPLVAELADEPALVVAAHFGGAAFEEFHLVDVAVGLDAPVMKLACLVFEAGEQSPRRDIGDVSEFERYVEIHDTPPLALFTAGGC